MRFHGTDQIRQAGVQFERFADRPAQLRQHVLLQLLVAHAQRLGVARVEPGVTTGSVDLACREAIAASGWGEHFEHGTGHGVGLDIHEGPSVGPGSTAILEPGTVVTVEPGVYLPGTGGVRIEDTLVVMEHGSRPLTQFPKDVAV